MNKHSTRPVLRILAVILSLALLLTFTPLSGMVSFTASAATAKHPYYRVTVYWNVKNANSDAGNWFSFIYQYPDAYDSDSNTMMSKVISNETFHKAAEQEGEQHAIFELPGIPYKLTYNIYGRTKDVSEWYITKVTVEAINPVPNCGIGIITLWEGKLGENVARLGGGSNQNTISFNTNGPTFSGWTYSEVGSNASAVTNSYFSDVHAKGIYVKGATPISCDSTFYVPTNLGGVSYYSVTKGVVYDQYGGRYPDQRMKTYVKKQETGITYDGSNVDLYNSANRANDYTYTFGYDFNAGIRSEKTVTVKTFDYNVTFKDKDGNVLKTETVDYGKSATPPDSVPLHINDGKTKYDFSGWNYGADYYTNITDGSQYRSLYSCYFESNAFSGSGTQSDPYLIRNADDWESLRQRCLNYDTTDEYFRMENDITVSDPVGAYGHPFKGIFDGNSKTLRFDHTATGENAAPFNYIDGCTIKNLRTVGTINTAYKYAAGLVADLSGTVTIENCRSSVAINSTVSGDGTHAGFIAKANKGSLLTMRGCLFDGSFSGQSTNSCGGFIGWRSGGADIYDSVFAPSNIDIDLTDCSTFARNKVDTHNSYYLQTMGTDNLAMWKKGYTVTAGADVTINKGEGTPYKVSGITAYGTGLDYNKKFYAGTGDTLSLSHSDKTGYIFKNYSVNSGSVSGNTLTVGSADTTVNAVYNALYTVTWKNGNTVLRSESVESGKVPTYTGATPTKASDNKYSYTFKEWSPAVSAVTGNVTYTAVFTKTPLATHFSQSGSTYIINDETGWDIFCDMLAENTKGFFTGKTVKLGKSITVSRMAGSDYHDFTGTFDGQSYTLTFNYTADSESAAPFRNTESGCVIKNLHVNGTINTAYKYAAGLIAQQYGTATIENCRSSVMINSSVNGDGTHGGFVAVAGGATMKGCVFDGVICSLSSAARTSSCGGFVGWGSVNISDSVYNPAAVPDGKFALASTDCYTFSRRSGDVTNCYYTSDLGTAQGKQAYTITAGDDVTLALSGKATVYKVSQITAYADNSGLKYGDTFYAGSGDTVELTLGYTGTPAEGYIQNGFAASAGTLDGTVLTMPKDNVTVSAKIDFTDGIGASLVGHSISLDGDIGVNFYMELADDIVSSDTAYMQFTIPNGSKTETKKVFIKDARVEGNYHVFKCSVSAKDMNSIIKAQISDGNGGSGTEYTYSVKDYADYLLAHTGNHAEYAAAAPLVRAMLHYGAAAQEFFGSTYSPANEGIDSNGWENVTAQTINKPYDNTTGNLPEGTTIVGATLSLKSQTTLSLYFKSDTTLEFSCEGMTVKTEAKGDYQIARIRNIPAKMLSDDFTVSLGNGYHVTYSPLTYCYNVLSDCDQPDSLKHVAQTLYLYSQAADEYFG